MAVAYRASATGTAFATSFTTAKPTGTVADDVLLAFFASAGDYASMGTPTGGAAWILLDSIDAGFSASTKLWWKVAGGSEPSTYGFTQASSASGAAIVVAVSGGANTAPLHATSTAGATTTVTTPTLTPAGDADLDLRFALADFSGALTFTPPATYTEREDTGLGSVTVTLATKALSSSAATGTQNFTASTTPSDRSGYAALVTAPAASGRRIIIGTSAVHRAASW